MQNWNNYLKSIILFLGLAFMTSCTSGPRNLEDTSIDVPVNELVRVEKLAAKDLSRYATESLNPYIPYKSLLNPNDRSFFYVYRLNLPPGQNVSFEMVSAALCDEQGNKVASFMGVEQMREYWAEYGLFENDAQEINSKIDQTYLEKMKIRYSSRKARSYIIIFHGQSPAIERAKAKFDVSLGGRTMLIEVE